MTCDVSRRVTTNRQLIVNTDSQHEVQNRLHCGLRVVRFRLAQSPVTPIGQVVKTSPFHGENMSSNLVWVIDLQLVKDTYTSGRRRLMLNYGIQRSVSIFRFRGVAVNMLACHARERGFDSRRNRCPRQDVKLPTSTNGN